MSHDIIIEENQKMRKTGLLFLGGFFFFLSLIVIVSCGQKEKVIQKTVIEIPGQELETKNPALYKTRTQDGREITYLSTDFAAVLKPASLDEFRQYFHLPPVRQYNTGTCWCFATTSLVESELKRLGKPEVKLSEMFTVYWEYVEKARRFIREKGNSALGEGSEHNAVIQRMQQYGAVRESDYTGLLPGKTEHDHSGLFKEFSAYLKFCQENGYWDEDKAISCVKEILNKYLGRPPETIVVDGKTVTPKEYLENELGLRLSDYVYFISFRYLPFYTTGEFKVPDNWWHSQDYYNVPLEDFYAAILGAIKRGYTVTLGGDISEPGNSGADDVAIIPTYDLLPSLIDQDSREFRFYNRTSTDDHLVHLVGYKEMGNHTWFLIKDSWQTAYEGKFPGYFFYRDDYIKLKSLTFLTHKDAVAEVLQKFEPR
jgi:bleomycin hydrolase